MLNLALFGPPGAGKATQGEKLLHKYQLLCIAPGDLFREHIEQLTPLGKQVRSYIEQGGLVPDELVLAIIDKELQSKPWGQGVLFDGFPRTITQAQALDARLASYHVPLHAMIMLEVPEHELKQRIQERSRVLGRIDDQSTEQVQTRLEVYLEKTLPVAFYYQAQKKLFRIQGTGPIDKIFGDIVGVIEKNIWLNHSTPGSRIYHG